MVFGVLAVVASTSVPAQCLPDFKNGWIRIPPPGGMGMAAGFGQFHNGCAQPLKVTAAQSSAFADVSLHQTTQTNGVSGMRAVPELALPAGKSVALAPGGLHLMLMEASAPLQEGARVPMTFTLQDGREIKATLEVRKRAPGS
ncbi:copper chaperone PCu(A)C [Xanthomonas fragariae]|uniref:copper chaperone PCu(A)C n=1 Tax=Xanthomonas fragariae TaxID=48664 RepID=UPI0022AB4139|nr:copper chaperone PCu(A)C [Xanthomonas fragariae]WAT16542.1 copper chaperone PCu(A)C [Xanthomonas fragariae]